MPDSWPFLSAFFLLFLSYVCSDALQVPTEDRRFTLVYRRGDVSGLFPFPRVGRSQPASDDPFGQTSVHGVSKRQGLIPFPRVGKRHSHALLSTTFFPRAVPIDNIYEDYPGPFVHNPRPMPVVGLSPLGEEFSLQSGVGKRSQEATSEGMWFGPRLGRRRRRSTELGGETEDGGQLKQQGGSWASGGTVQRTQPGSSFWSAADEGASSREFLERHPNLRSILRSKEVHSTTDEDDEVEQEDSEVYGEPETSVVDDMEAFGEDPADTVREGRRKRRQPEELETKKSAPKDAASKGEGTRFVNRWTASNAGGSVVVPGGSSTRDQH